MNGFLNSALALTLIAASFGTLLATAAEAKHPWGVNNRQARQQRRIGAGDANGSLTARESARIEAREARLNQQEARMRASGGGLSCHERRRLEHEQNGLSRNIYRQKHDAQVQ